MSLPIEVRYYIATAAIGALLYLFIGAYMAVKTARWPNIAFALMPITRRRAIRFQNPKTLRFVRGLGVCLALLAVVMLYSGAERYRWIKHVEAFDAAHPLTH